ncbi:MAG: hypothetical protein Q9184_007741, partial [Pyrenodesmia sp. 2 TL-2023]
QLSVWCKTGDQGALGSQGSGGFEICHRPAFEDGFLVGIACEGGGVERLGCQDWGWLEIWRMPGGRGEERKISEKNEGE